MKPLERLTLATTGVFTISAIAYLAQQAIRVRAERLFRIAAGESVYERKHSHKLLFPTLRFFQSHSQ